MSLLVVGTMAFDAIETPFGKTDKILGGAATYISLAASNVCKNISIVSVVGGDFPEEYIRLFNERNISLDGVEVIKDQKSFFWSGRYNLDMNTRETLVTELNVLADFKPVVPKDKKRSKYLMLGNLTPSVQMSVIDQMTEKPKLIMLDTMNFWMDNAMDDLKNVLQRIDVLSINDEEARQLSGENSLKKAARKILQMGPSILIIKKGEHGALLFSEDEVFSAPALPIDDVFDPTGAGDTFAGGFIGYLVKTSDLSFDNMKRAVIYGSVMASFCVEKFGVERLLDLNSKVIYNRLLMFKKLSDFEFNEYWHL
jgi:sugar/nucleoside kinase (ribokinase family)